MGCCGLPLMVCAEGIVQKPNRASHSEDAGEVAMTTEQASITGSVEYGVGVAVAVVVGPAGTEIEHRNP